MSIAPIQSISDLLFNIRITYFTPTHQIIPAKLSPVSFADCRVNGDTYLIEALYDVRNPLTLHERSEYIDCGIVISCVTNLYSTFHDLAHSHIIEPNALIACKSDIHLPASLSSVPAMYYESVRFSVATESVDGANHISKITFLIPRAAGDAWFRYYQIRTMQMFPDARTIFGVPIEIPKRVNNSDGPQADLYRPNFKKYNKKYKSNKYSDIRFSENHSREHRYPHTDLRDEVRHRLEKISTLPPRTNGAEIFDNAVPWAQTSRGMGFQER